MIRDFRFIQKKGYLKEDNHDLSENTEIADNDNPILAACIGASIQNRIALGERAGKRVRKHVCFSLNGAHAPEFKGKLCCALDGFSIHARTHVEEWQRGLLEKLLRYILRPSLAANRFSLTQDGNILYELKNAHSDGATHLLLSPLELIEKLVSIIPPPRINLIRYHGCLAPHSAIRDPIVPKPDPDLTADSSCPHALGIPDAKYLAYHQESSRKSTRAYHIAWSRLLKRVFKIDLENCPLCGGKLKIISAILDGQVIRKILNHLKLSPDPPSLTHSRFPLLRFE